jgi:hypothetical protein
VSQTIRRDSFVILAEENGRGKEENRRCFKEDIYRTFVIDSSKRGLRIHAQAYIHHTCIYKKGEQIKLTTHKNNADAKSLSD